MLDQHTNHNLKQYKKTTYLDTIKFQYNCHYCRHRDEIKLRILGLIEIYVTCSVFPNYGTVIHISNRR